MGQEQLTRATRHTTRRRVLGPDARCDRCGWRDPVALTRGEDGTRCYECHRNAGQKTTVEQHHHLGRAVDPATVPVTGNVHRDLSDRQYDWPPAVRRNPHRDPLLWLAAALFGLRDHLGWWLAWLDRIARWFLDLSTALASRDGARWWETVGVAPVWQEGTS